jgi:hypothetical protein
VLGVGLLLLILGRVISRAGASAPGEPRRS